MSGWSAERFSPRQLSTPSVPAIPLASVRKTFNIRSGQTTKLPFRIRTLPDMNAGNYRLQAVIADSNGQQSAVVASQAVFIDAPVLEFSASLAKPPRPAALHSGGFGNFSITLESLGNVPASGKLSAAFTNTPDDLSTTVAVFPY